MGIILLTYLVLSENFIIHLLEHERNHYSVIYMFINRVFLFRYSSMNCEPGHWYLPTTRANSLSDARQTVAYNFILRLFDVSLSQDNVKIIFRLQV